MTKKRNSNSNNRLSSPLSCIPVIIIQLACLHNVLLLLLSHVVAPAPAEAYTGPGRFFLKYECGDRTVSTPEMVHIRELLTQAQGSGGATYPARFVLSLVDFQATAHCPGLQNTSANYGPPRGQYKAYWPQYLCFLCLEHITTRMLDEYCWMNAQARYASTECVISYKYFPDDDKPDDFCETPWPPELYPR